MNTNKVFLVGAGPGDPGLFTLKGRACVEQADVILYDYLSSEDLLAFAKPDCEKIYVGKKADQHELEQFEINQLLLSKAASHKVVVRLKGGDPFVYGRGGEEAQFLMRNGVAVEVVPGITSAIAVPAYAGIPITHRELASSFAVVTGHSQEGSLGKIPVPNCDTLVYLMGVRNLEKIVTAVMASGRHADTPIAIIQWGTTFNQKTLVSTLGNVVADFEKSQLSSPAIIVVGAVVAMREQLSWFERRPLFGQTVVITRSRTQSSGMRAALQNLGANVIEYPTIEIKPIARNSALTTAIQSLSEFHWIIFTSVNAVEILMEKVRDLGMDARIFHANKVAVVGSSTQAALQRYGLQADFVPSQFVAEAVLKEFPESVKGLNVLIPCAAAAREVLPEGLAALGAKITAVPVYETLQPVKQNVNWRDVHWITFSSSSTVENFIAIEKIIPKHLKIASIGPITTQTLKHFHYAPTVEGNPHTIAGLVDTMAGRL